MSTLMPLKFLVGVSLCLARNLLWAPYDALARGSGGSTAAGVIPLATNPAKASRILKLLQVLGEIAMATSSGVPQRRTTLKGATRTPQRGKARAHALVM